MGLFGAYYATLKFVPILGLAIGLVIALVMPFLLVASFRFRLYNTSYRGLRLNFAGSVKSAYVTFLVLPIATVLTLYLLAPFTHQRIKAYQHNNSRFGRSNFTFDAAAGSFYKVYFLAFLQLLLIIALMAFAAYSMFKGGMEGMAKEAVMGIVIVGYILSIIAFLLVVPYFISRIQNLVWNHTRLGEHRFISTLTTRGLAWVIFSNFFFIVLTLGLFKPFADIRLARYRVEHMALAPAGDIDEFIAGEQQKISAAGTETAEVFDLDIGF